MSKVSQNYEVLRGKVDSAKAQIKKVNSSMNLKNFKGSSTTLVPSNESLAVSKLLLKDIGISLNDLKNELNAILIVGQNIKTLDKLLERDANILDN